MKRDGDEMEQDDTQKRKLELKVKHFFWSNVFDTQEKFKITLPKGFLQAKLDDGSDYPLTELQFPMIRVVDVLQTVGVFNTQ